jgi:hypothetical protein
MSRPRTVGETYMGDWIDYTDPDPSAIKIADIAQSLSLTCRFGGLIPFFFSVAQHALLVRQLVIDMGHSEFAQAALHHDSHEAFLGDVPTPLKATFGNDYHRMVARFDDAIGEALDLEPSEFYAEEVRRADQMALRIEAAALKVSRGVKGAWPWRELPPALGYPIEERNHFEVAREFVGAHVGNYEMVAV